jgi:superfamily II DNA or RNA helicase
MQAMNLDEYFTHYGTLLGRQAAQATRPLHVPGTDPVVLPELCRQPFDAQAHVIQAGAKALRRQKALMVVAEMGTGKTLMAVAIAQVHAKGRPYRALVMCPGQLVDKWEREIVETIPDVDVRQIEEWRNIIGVNEQQACGKGWKPIQRPTWYIIPRDRAKLGCGWKPAYMMRTVMGEGHVRCPDCGLEQLEKAGLFMPPEAFAKKKMFCQNPQCRAALWECVGKPWRWEPARYIHKYMKGFFDYFILDEAHEEKSATSEQGNAAGALAAASKKVIAMTGTLIGGRADHVHPLLMRLAPQSLVAEGLGWHNNMAFNERYGRIETKTVEREGGRHDDEDASYGRGKKKSKTKKVCPGIMPTLFGKHILGSTIFLGLSEVADGLPAFDEQVVPVNLSGQLEEEYREIEDKLVKAVKELLKRGNKALLGAMLQTLLQYPDYPFGWTEVGYNERTPSGEKVFVPVVWPKNLPENVTYPKEAKLVELVKAERQRGRQCWVFIQYTGEKDCLSRMSSILARSGLKTEVLRSSVELAKREAWIRRNAPGVDVVLSHPKLVETGLDLFDKGGAYNFPTLIFYQTGYHLFTLRQASRRAWRIGQRRDCKVIYLYYAHTLQDRAMALMGKKMEAAQALDGKFSTEGLAGLAGEEGSAEMALAKSLAGQINEGAASRHWAKVQTRQGAVVNRTGIIEDLPEFDAETIAMLRSAFAKAG